MVMNILMIFVFPSPYSDSNTVSFVMIFLALFMLVLVIKGGKTADRRKVLPERAGIWGIAAANLIWFINRIDQTKISDSQNMFFLILIIGMGIFFIAVTISRRLHKSNTNSNNNDDIE